MPCRGFCSTALCLLLFVGVIAWTPLGEEPARAEDAAIDRSETVVIEDFYGAVNAVLRTGIPPDWTGILSERFVAHLDPPGLPPSHDGLVSRILSLGATFPGLQLQPHSLSDAGGRIVAEVSIEGPTNGSFLGLSLDGRHVAWGPVDLFRIADGLIVEMWGGRADAPLMQPLVDLPIEVPVSSLHTIDLGRITIEPGSDAVGGSDLGTDVLHIEHGELTVEVTETVGRLMPRTQGGAVLGEVNRRMLGPGEPANMVAGDVLLLPQGAEAIMRNDGGAAAVVFTVSVRKPAGPRHSAGPQEANQHVMVAAEATGVSAIDLGPQPVLALPNGLSRIGIGRVTLASGTALPIDAPGAVLGVVEDGLLNATSDVGVVWSRRGGDGAITTATGASYGPGDGVLFEPGTTGEVLSVGGEPLALLVVTITPVAP